MQMIRCTKCMGELRKGEVICPRCGFRQDGSAQPGNALRRNTILNGRYLVGNVIGQGGFGITYVGWDLTLEMKVAVKEYFPSGSASRSNSLSNQIQWSYLENEEAQRSEGMDRFLKEARRMARLDSVPSVVRVRDAFRENQTAYIVMDFVEGDTLKTYLLRHGLLRYQACMSLLAPVLDSLAIIHDNGFIHRDISPDNIMLQPDGQARLLDMGAAVDVQASGGHASMAVVKRNFSAPEQYMESEPLGSWTDVYAMAATIYYCMTGKVVPEAMEREFKKTPLFFDPALGIPEHVISALNDALALNAERRIRDMRELKRRLMTPGSGAPTMEDYEDKTAPYSGNGAYGNQDGIHRAVSSYGNGTAPVADEIRPTGQPGQADKQKDEPIHQDVGPNNTKKGTEIMKKAGITAAQKAKKGLSRVLMVLGGITLAFFLLIIAVSFMDSGSSDKKHEETKVTTAAEKSRPAQTTTAKETETETEAETMEIAEEVEDWEEGEYGFYKLLEDDTYRFMLYNPFSDLGSRISLPGTFNNKPVTEIATMAFAYSDFEQIRLPYGIRSIGENAFDGCPNLEAVFIPSSVEEIPQPLVEDCPNESYFIFVTGLTETEVQELVDEGSWCEDWQGATDWVVYFGLSDVTDELPSNSWQKLNDGTWLYFDAGYVPITEWLDIMGKTYFFDETGAALSGWLEGLKYTYYFDLEDCFLCKGWTEVEGKNYYFDLEDGHMLTNMATPDGYWVDENGVWTETGYILPYSDSRKLSDEQVSLMDHDQLQLAINEIYARHGKIFTQQENQAYFKGKDWYRPSSSFSESMLSDIEKDNVKVLSKYRDLKN